MKKRELNNKGQLTFFIFGKIFSKAKYLILPTNAQLSDCPTPNRRRLTRKSQLTFFILIGFIILFVMGFLFYINKQVTGYKTKKETQLSQDATFDIIPIKSYVDTCLKKTADDGMKLLGEQGGFIYEAQGGIKNQPQLIQGTDFVGLKQINKDEINVSYGIVMNITSCDVPGIICREVEEDFDSGLSKGAYPWMSFPDPSERNCSSRIGCFGFNYLPTLGSERFSMYNQLRVFINNTIENCTDFSYFKQEGFSIEKNGTIEVEVNTTNETVVVVLKYPLIIIDPTSKKSTKLENFYYDTKIRLKTLYELSYEIVDKDIKNESFNVSNFNIPLEMSLTIWKNLNHPDLEYINPLNDNIVRIEDDFSNIPFVFQFARQNRPPILNHTISPIQVSDGYVLTEKYFENVTVYDPDDIDNTVKYYTGLTIGFTPDTTFNYSVNFMDGDFIIRICVSDLHSAQPCKLGQDLSSDWQEVQFEVI